MDSPHSSISSTNSDQHPILPRPLKTRPIAYLTRIETFAAAHRMHNRNLDDDMNKAIFGKCNNQNGHGHNYKVEVTIKGPVDETTGMVINLSELRDIMTMVIEPMDHKRLDIDVEYFVTTGLVATAENIAVYLYNKIHKLLPHYISLVNLRLYETEKHYIDYRGEVEDEDED